MKFILKDKYDIEDLKQIMKLLRSENGCPWDKVQTHESIRKNFIEETYEVIEAIDKQDSALMKEELGDVLLQIIFHSQIEDEKDIFCFEDVVNDICKKLIIRHPHVFSDTKVCGVDDVIKNWNNIKQQTKGQINVSQTLDSVPRQLPALMRSEKVQSRTGKSGFDYPDAVMAFDDLKSEISELSSAISNNDLKNIAEELGDVIFSAVNVSRLYHLDAEELLTRACDKFISRFKEVEVLAKKENIDMKTANIDTLNSLWKKVKEKCIQGDKNPHEDIKIL